MSVERSQKPLEAFLRGSFGSLFVLATVLTTAATFFAVSGIGPIGPASPVMIWLLVGNLFVIGFLAAIVARQVIRARQGDAEAGGGRLARRFVSLFSVSAILPAVLVAAFLGVTITRGIDAWFSDRVRTIVEGAATNAQTALDGIAEDIRLDVALMATDLNGAAEGLVSEPDVYRNFFNAQSQFRDFPIAYLLARNGDTILRSAGAPQLFVPPAPTRYEIADSGDVSVRLFEDNGAFRALYRLSAYQDTYLYVTRLVGERQLASLQAASRALVEYRETESSSSRLRFIFAISFLEIAALILLLAIRLGVGAAQEITRPIGRLARAAEKVSDGDLSVRVPEPQRDNEVAELAQSFNRMTSQLGDQRRDLEGAMMAAEDRRQFLETVLAGVSAGVIRIDRQDKVSVFNQSAVDMLAAGTLYEGQSIHDLVPDFSAVIVAARQSGTPSEADIMRSHDGEPRQFRVIVAPEGDGGHVITFDDTTRIVFAQRQTAWRDVARRVAHEIRNPLTPIQLSAERLKRRYRKLAPEDDQVFDRCTSTILRQVSEIGRMVEEFSSFARMPKPHLSEFDIAAVLKDIVFSQRLYAPRVRFDLAGIENVMSVRGDKRLLSQALVNIIKNAGEAVQRQPVPETEDSPHGAVTVRLEAQESSALIVIEDTGEGFPVQDRQRLLEPYVTSRERGVGLGLAIVHRIIQDHGGTLKLADRQDGMRGARVEVELPVDGPSEEIVSSWETSEERV